jgi:hypothetical protein
MHKKGIKYKKEKWEWKMEWILNGGGDGQGEFREWAHALRAFGNIEEEGDDDDYDYDYDDVD